MARRSLGVVTQVFWLLVLAVICLFVFFLALGTFSIGDVGWLAVAVGVLVVAYLVHERERRGF